jgi:hypothetical protein
LFSEVGQEGEEPKTAELPTDRTAMRMTAFMTDGRTSMPASSMAMTKGDALASALLSPPMRRLSL